MELFSRVIGLFPTTLRSEKLDQLAVPRWEIGRRKESQNGKDLQDRSENMVERVDPVWIQEVGKTWSYSEVKVCED